MSSLDYFAGRNRHKRSLRTGYRICRDYQIVIHAIPFLFISSSAMVSAAAKDLSGSGKTL